jgi:hypothetical protein
MDYKNDQHDNAGRDSGICYIKCGPVEIAPETNIDEIGHGTETYAVDQVACCASKYQTERDATQYTRLCKIAKEQNYGYETGEADQQEQETVVRKDSEYSARIPDVYYKNPPDLRQRFAHSQM